MLKHEENTQSSAQPPSPPAAEVRVTPEELAAAITRLEAKKDAHLRQADGTVAIGDVVEQLGLNATPEEILAEVEAERAKQTTRQGKRFPQRGRLRILFAIGAVLVGLGVSRGISPYFAGNIIPSDATQTTINSQFFPTAPQPLRILVNPDLLVGDAFGKLVLLSEVGDNQPVHCTYNNGRFQQYRPDFASATWTLAKHGGQLYVRGWLLKMSPKVLQTEGADVSAVKDSEFTVPITLPLKGVSVLEGAGGDTKFHALNIHLDKHAYEKWNP